MRTFPHHFKQGGGGMGIYVTYVYDFNAILTKAMNNRSDEEMIRAFASLTGDFKNLGINPGFHVMDNEASTNLK